MKLDSNKRLAIFITIFTIVLLAGLTYTYFSASVSNTNNEKIQTSTATMSLEFDDGDNGVNATLNLGESITKKFTLENTGTVDAYGKINWYNLVNTYTANSLSWVLEKSTTENGTYSVVDRGDVPSSVTQSTVPLIRSILVPSSTTYYFKLTITLNNLPDLDQTSDVSATMNSKFSLESASLTSSAVSKIQSLVAGSPTNTLNLITKESPSGASCTNTLAYDGTVDNNLRYVGANPCNYVTFNGETAGWRIVGVMNNVDDGTGNLETRLKIVRNGELGSYSWDTSPSNINNGFGANDWTGSVLKDLLNTDYLNTSIQSDIECYRNQNMSKTGISTSMVNGPVYEGVISSGNHTLRYTDIINSLSQTQISNSKWNLGGLNPSAGYITTTMYQSERGTTVWGSTSGQTCNDDACPRATEWIGKIALVYPSDYGFATSGGQNTLRANCVEDLSISAWYNSNITDCLNNDWMKFDSYSMWALTPASNYGTKSFRIRKGSKGLTYHDTYSAIGVVPSTYLKSDVSITGGNGTETDPYILN